ELGLDVVHVPYKGAAPAMADILGGRIAVKMDTVISSMPYIKTGQIRPLAITSYKRSALLPNVPTMSELGIADYESKSSAWMGILAPKDTPHEYINILNHAVTESMKTPKVLQRLDDYAVEPVSSTSAELQNQIKAELK